MIPFYHNWDFTFCIHLYCNIERDAGLEKINHMCSCMCIGTVHQIHTLLAQDIITFHIQPRYRANRAIRKWDVPRQAEIFQKSSTPLWRLWVQTLPRLKEVPSHWRALNLVHRAASLKTLPRVLPVLIGRRQGFLAVSCYFWKKYITSSLSFSFLSW